MNASSEGTEEYYHHRKILLGGSCTERMFFTCTRRIAWAKYGMTQY